MKVKSSKSVSLVMSLCAVGIALLVSVFVYTSSVDAKVCFAGGSSNFDECKDYENMSDSSSECVLPLRSLPVEGMMCTEEDGCYRCNGCAPDYISVNGECVCGGIDCNTLQDKHCPSDQYNSCGNCKIGQCVCNGTKCKGDEECNQDLNDCGNCPGTCIPQTECSSLGAGWSDEKPAEGCYDTDTPKIGSKNCYKPRECKCGESTDRGSTCTCAEEGWRDNENCPDGQTAVAKETRKDKQCYLCEDTETPKTCATYGYTYSESPCEYGKPWAEVPLTSGGRAYFCCQSGEQPVQVDTSLTGGLQCYQCQSNSPDYNCYAEYNGPSESPRFRYTDIGCENHWNGSYQCTHFCNTYCKKGSGNQCVPDGKSSSEFHENCCDCSKCVYDSALNQCEVERCHGNFPQYLCPNDPPCQDTCPDGTYSDPEDLVCEDNSPVVEDAEHPGCYKCSDPCPDGTYSDPENESACGDDTQIILDAEHPGCYKCGYCDTNNAICTTVGKCVEPDVKCPEKEDDISYTDGRIFTDENTGFMCKLCVPAIKPCEEIDASYHSSAEGCNCTDNQMVMSFGAGDAQQRCYKCVDKTEPDDNTFVCYDRDHKTSEHGYNATTHPGCCELNEVGYRFSLYLGQGKEQSEKLSWFFAHQPKNVVIDPSDSGYGTTLRGVVCGGGTIPDSCDSLWSSRDPGNTCIGFCESYNKQQIEGTFWYLSFPIRVQNGVGPTAFQHKCCDIDNCKKTVGNFYALPYWYYTGEYDGKYAGLNPNPDNDYDNGIAITFE